MAGKRPTPKWNEIREALWARSDGMCEISGLPLDFETFDAHHRRPKGMGGTYRPLTDNVANLLALLPLVHNIHPKSVHLAPKWSRRRGYLLPSHWNDEAMVISPVLYRGQTWVTLDEDGDLGEFSGRSQAYLWRQLAGEEGTMVGTLKAGLGQYLRA